MNIGQLYTFFEKYSFIISTLIVTSLFILFYPGKIVTIDEHDYLGNAELLLQNGLKQSCNHDEYKGQWEVSDYCVSKYNIGSSFFYIPSILISTKVVFFTNLAVFLIGIYIFYRLLKKFEISTVFLYLYAFYPANIFYSRTLLSEILSSVLILAFFYLLHSIFIKERNWKISILAGIIGGTAVLVRYSNVIPITLITIGITIPFLQTLKVKDLIKRILYILLGSLPFALFILIFNNYLYGSPLRTGYYFSHEESNFVAQNIPEGIIVYLLILMILYPLMLLTIFFLNKKIKLSILLPLLFMLIFYSGINTIIFEGKLLNFITSVRFLMPIIPLLIFSYVSFLNRFYKNTNFKIIALLSIFALILSTSFINYLHKQYLNSTTITDFEQSFLEKL